jgi:hypothetical protein
MGAGEQWARRQGARRIMLNVWEFNAGALGLYESLGYTTFSRNLTLRSRCCNTLVGIIGAVKILARHGADVTRLSRGGLR